MAAVESAANPGEAVEATPNNDKKPVDLIKASMNENDDCKLFVGSLAWETTDDQFKEYFAKYGAIKEAKIKFDGTGRSKGFGFVLFEDADAITKILAEESHSLGNRKIEPKKATPRERIRKIFVGGVNPEFPEADLRTHFEQYGEIEELEMPMNKEKNIRKGFVFITFKTAEGCEAATAPGLLKQELGDRQVDVKKAIPQDQYQRGRGRGGPGGRGGRGGFGDFGGYGMDPYGYYGYDPWSVYYDPFAYATYPAPGAMSRGRGRGRGGRGRGRPY
jgi:RNA recognition motif-containing protein